MRERGVSVVIKSVGFNALVIADHDNVVVEDGAARGGVVSAPVGNELPGRIDELAAIVEISVLVDTVVVEAVRVERLFIVDENNVFACFHHLRRAVVEASFASEREGVAFPIMHVAHRADGIGLLVEISAVASKVAAFVKELHIAFHDLRVGILAVRVVVKFIGMQQIDAFVVLALRRGVAAFCGDDEAERKQAQKNQDDASVPVVAMMSFALRHY